MLEPDLKTELEKLDSHLVDIKKNQGGGIWRAFFNGVFSALGYAAGLAIIVLVMSFVLQKTGLLEPFKKQISVFQDIINSAKDLTTGAKEKMNKMENQTIILPDGREVKLKAGK